MDVKFNSRKGTGRFLERSIPVRFSLQQLLVLSSFVEHRCGPMAEIRLSTLIELQRRERQGITCGKITESVLGYLTPRECLPSDPGALPASQRASDRKHLSRQRQHTRITKKMRPADEELNIGTQCAVSRSTLSKHSARIQRGDSYDLHSTTTSTTLSRSEYARV